MIRISNLSFGYRRKKLLYNDLSLTLQPGNIYGLLGKNGAGKSTLLKNMSGLLFPTAGNILVSNFTPSKRLPSFLQTIYFIPEEVYVPAVSINRYKSLFTPFYPDFDGEKFNGYLDQLQVNPHDKLTSMSFGQQKKFVIAFALACNTALLLLDEPTNGLDIPSKTQFRKLIASIMNENRTIIISTHQVRDLENLIDRVIIVDEGKLLLHASIQEVNEKLYFSTVNKVPEQTEIFYVEDSLRGFSIIQENKEDVDSKINLEQLFNAVTESPDKTRSIFSGSY
jgi:ABC-2 type transport system ATP-binding protein